MLLLSLGINQNDVVLPNPVIWGIGLSLIANASWYTIGIRHVFKNIIQTQMEVNS